MMGQLVLMLNWFVIWPLEMKHGKTNEMKEGKNGKEGIGSGIYFAIIYLNKRNRSGM